MAKGMTRKVNKNLNAEVKQQLGKRSLSYLGEAQFHRRFFRISNDYIKTKPANRADESFILLEGRNGLVKDRMEWCLEQ